MWLISDSYSRSSYILRFQACSAAFGAAQEETPRLSHTISSSNPFPETPAIRTLQKRQHSKRDTSWSKHQSERAAAQQSALDHVGFSLVFLIIFNNETNSEVLVDTGQFFCWKEHIKPVDLEEERYICEIKQNCDLFAIQPSKTQGCQVVNL